MRVDPIFFVLAAFLGLRHTNAVSIAVFVAIVLLSVLWHELAHAVAFPALGYRSRILLHGMGGLTIPGTDQPLSAVAPEPDQPVLHPSVVRANNGTGPAIELLRRPFQERPDEGTGVRLVRALIEAGRLDEALAVVTGPRSERAGNNAASVVGRALFQARRYDDAARAGERSFAHDPHPTLPSALRAAGRGPGAPRRR